MILTVTHNNRLDPARWESAQHILAVLPIDTRCFLCRHPNGFHDTADEFLKQPTTWDPQTHTHVLQPFYDFHIHLHGGGSIRGSLSVTNEQALSDFREAIQYALNTPHTRANRRRWELDDLRMIAERRGEDARAVHDLNQQRQEAALAFTYYDRYDQQRLRQRHQRARNGLAPFSTVQETEELWTNLIAAGAAIRSGHPDPILLAEPILP